MKNKCDWQVRSGGLPLQNYNLSFLVPFEHEGITLETKLFHCLVVHMLFPLYVTLDASTRCD